METTKRNYYGLLPTEVRDSRILSAQAKLIYAELTSRTDTNNACTVSEKELSEWCDTDNETIGRWILLLQKEKFILAENIIEEKNSFWKISLLFHQRPTIQEKKNEQAIAPAASDLFEKKK